MNGIQRICFFVSAAGLLFLLTGNRLFMSEFATHSDTIHKECADLTSHIEHSLSIDLGEQAPNDKLSGQSNDYPTPVVPFFDIDFENSWISFVWQPPKFS